jgi:hypothetical protein
MWNRRMELVLFAHIGRYFQHTSEIFKTRIKQMHQKTAYKRWWQRRSGRTAGEEEGVDRMPLWIELLCDRSNRRRLVPNALCLPPFGFAVQQL